MLFIILLTLKMLTTTLRLKTIIANQVANSSWLVTRFLDTLLCGTKSVMCSQNKQINKN